MSVRVYLRVRTSKTTIETRGAALIRYAPDEREDIERQIRVASDAALSHDAHWFADLMVDIVEGQYLGDLFWHLGRGGLVSVMFGYVRLG